jgi:hypothetical protein
MPIASPGVLTDSPWPSPRRYRVKKFVLLTVCFVMLAAMTACAGGKRVGGTGAYDPGKASSTPR